jgi:hypothetical protein
MAIEVPILGGTARYFGDEPTALLHRRLSIAIKEYQTLTVPSKAVESEMSMKFTTASSILLQFCARLSCTPPKALQYGWYCVHHDAAVWRQSSSPWCGGRAIGQLCLAACIAYSCCYMTMYLPSVLCTAYESVGAPPKIPSHF